MARTGAWIAAAVVALGLLAPVASSARLRPGASMPACSNCASTAWSSPRFPPRPVRSRCSCLRAVTPACSASNTTRPAARQLRRLPALRCTGRHDRHRDAEDPGTRPAAALAWQRDRAVAAGLDRGGRTARPGLRRRERVAAVAGRYRRRHHPGAGVGGRGRSGRLRRNRQRACHPDPRGHGAHGRARASKRAPRTALRCGTALRPTRRRFAGRARAG